MAYVTKEEVANLRKNLRKEFPKFRISVTRKGVSEVRVALTSGPALLYRDGKPVEYEQVNHFHIHNRYGEENFDKNTLNVLRRLVDTTKKVLKWYDNSDSSVDYFDSKCFLSFNIGAWDKPYEAKN